MNNFIYLNNAATSWPKPPCVAEAISRALAQRPGAAGRGGIDDFDVFDEVRKRMSRILGVAAHDHIALGSNATWGLNLCLFGYPFRKGDTVVTTKAEHNSVLRPLNALARRGLIKIVYVDTDKQGRIAPVIWEEALTLHRPALVAFTHASNITGAVNDANTLTKAAAAVGACVLIDASQSCGLVSVEADSWGADMVVFTGHKYLLGPQGTGGLYVRPGLSLTPHLIGGTGAFSDLDTMPEEMPSHLEAGTGNEPSFHGLLAALEWLERNPADKAANDEMLAVFRKGLVDAGADIIAPDGACTPIISFNLPGQTPAETGYILNESYDVVCRSGLHCAPKLFGCIDRAGGTVRFSMSRFTTMDDIDYTINAVRDICTFLG